MKPKITIRVDCGANGFTDEQEELYKKTILSSRIADAYEIDFYDDFPCDGGSCGMSYFFEDGNYSKDKEEDNFINSEIQESAIYAEEMFPSNTSHTDEG